MFTHVKRTEDEKRLHISHLYHYVSAYERCRQEIDLLVEMLEGALVEAKEKRIAVEVNRDGEMFFMVYPSGQISLCLRWKDYEVIREEE